MARAPGQFRSFIYFLWPLSEQSSDHTKLWVVRFEEARISPSAPKRREKPPAVRA
jgi:hypothetical protein